MVLRHTNRKVRDLLAQANHHLYYMALFSYEEFLACIAILLRAGSDRDNFTSLHKMWNSVDGKPFYRAVIFKNRFKFFLRAIRFGNYRTRHIRKV